VYIWIGDATGHGAPAALITSAARSAAAVIESLPDVTPATAMTVLNRAINQTSKGQILMTFFIGAIDFEKGVFTYASASHDPPYLLKRTGEKLSRKDLKPLNDVNGPRLGEQKDFAYPETSVDFKAGDLLFFYTDGILDVQDLEGKKWGERVFLKSLVDSSNSQGEVRSKLDLIKSQIETFRSGATLIDDVTMVMCEFDKGAA
jgi:phosphoserine phosphatase RsbU/P